MLNDTSNIVNSHPVCIAGMHRSGTSLVTSLLNHCGLYLGPEENLLPPDQKDNSAGYWENNQFVLLNSKMLSLLDAEWDRPPQLRSGWSKDKKFDSIREEAKELLQVFEGKGFWGWKDPRNSITLEFWKGLLPNLRYVICLRHPFEVAQSLAARELSHVPREAAVRLWEEYYTTLSNNFGLVDYIVTHYDSYFYDPENELTRVLEFLTHTASKETIQDACTKVADNLKRGFLTKEQLNDLSLTPHTLKLYERFASHAGAVYQASIEDEQYQKSLEASTLSKAIQKIRTLEDVNAERAQKLTEEHKQLHKCKYELALTKEKFKQVEEDKIRLNEDIDKLYNELQDLRYQYDSLVNSRSWKLACCIKKIFSIFGFIRPAKH